MRTIAITMLVALIGLSGCLESSDGSASTDITTVDTNAGSLFLDLPQVLPELTFVETIVDAAIGYTNDLYEPTMEISDSGVIYVTGHTIGVDTTGAPVFMSHDNGETWEQLPFTGTTTMPAGMHGATPPVSDEIFLVAGDDGYLYGVDITAFAFPVNAWANDGGEHVYYNPNAYDRPGAVMDPLCSASSLNDRPWAAYGNGKLLMVNNPGGGPMEIGVMDVPVEQPVDVVGNQVTGPEWNLCASTGGWIPGIPDMRDDHFFAVPQVSGPSGDSLHLVMGYADMIQEVEQKTVIEFTNTGGGTSNYGQVVFDEEGTMFVGVRNNTAEPTPDDGMDNRTGQIAMVLSTDSGETFTNHTLVLDAPVTTMYMDGNMHGEGALLTWGQIGDNGTDYYSAHLFANDDGTIRVENVGLIVAGGPGPSAHVQGAAVGPDGRAHIVTYHGGYGPLDGATPLHVWVQSGGPTLPIAIPAMEAIEA